MPRRSAEEPLLVPVGDGVDHVVDLAVEDSGQVVDGERHAVVGEAVLRKVIGADLVRAFARADLAAAGVGQLLLTLALLQVQQLRPQQVPGLDPVLEL